MKTTLRLKSLFARFGADQRGNVALITGLLAIPLVGAIGVGIDYTRLVSYRLKVDSAATASALAAIDTARALLLSNPKMPAAELEAAAKARAQQVFNALAPAESEGAVVFNKTRETVGAQVAYTGSLNTTLMGIFNIQTMAVKGESKSEGQTETSDANKPPDPNMLIEENFDVSGVTANVSYGSFGNYKNFNEWKTNKAGVEIGTAGTYGPPPPNGAPYVAELDAGGNTYLAKRIYLTKGSYELRYWYKDRLAYADYAAVHLCAASMSDAAWADANFGKANWFTYEIGKQSNAIAAYLELAPTETPPVAFTETLHTVVDACIMSGGRWIERSVKITTYAAGFYWLAFQAEGFTDGVGGVLNNIRFCRNACPGTVTEAFPWAAGTVLFSDGFETPVGDTTANWTERTLDASGTNSGWTNLPNGWTTWPENQIDFLKWGPGGTNVIELDASTRPGASNRGISRRFILTPGYYSLTYFYRSHGFIPEYTLCGAADVNSNVAIVKATSTTSLAPDSMIVRAFVDPDLLFSHPRTDPVLRARASWFNPDGSPATLPKLPSTLVDACVSSRYTTLSTANIRINKTGFYWLTFQAGGTDDNWGGVIDKVSLTALGALSMSAPANVVTIPSAGIQPGAILTKPQLQFIAN